MMAGKGYKRGYNGVWILGDDLIPDDMMVWVFFMAKGLVFN